MSLPEMSTQRKRPARYVVTVRGSFPPNLAQCIAEAHAQALKISAQPRPQTDGQKPAA